jgi:nucleoside-diphosphate-sugar epimerase
MTPLAIGADIVRAGIDMKILVTGSAGHLGEALMRSLEATDHEALGLDRTSSIPI